MSDDPVCNVCGDRKSAHVSTAKGPYTHPREARGEGVYEEVSPGHIQGGFYPGDEYEVGPSYRFVPAQVVVNDAPAGEPLRPREG